MALRINWLFEDAKAVGGPVDEKEVTRLSEARDNELDYNKFMEILGADISTLIG